MCYERPLEIKENKMNNEIIKEIEAAKRIYKTLEGIFAYIMARKNGWKENQNQDLTN